MSTALIDNLVQTRLEEQAKRAAQLDVALLSQLKIDPPPPMDIIAEEADKQIALFVAWCQTDRFSPLSALPATPATVALYLQESTLPVEDLVPFLEIISRLHVASHHVDPTASYLVTAVMTKKAKIDAPRSWPKEEALRFQSLPYDLQRYVVRREAERDREVRRVQNRASNGAKRETEAA